MKIIWRRSETVGHCEIAFLGRWKVGGMHWDSFVPRSDDNKFAATCGLPGIKKMLGHYKNEVAAKERVESAINFWLSGADEITTEEQSKCQD